MYAFIERVNLTLALIIMGLRRTTRPDSGLSLAKASAALVATWLCARDVMWAEFSDIFVGAA